MSNPLPSAKMRLLRQLRLPPQLALSCPRNRDSLLGSCTFIRKSSSMAAPTAMQMSNRLRTVFAENKGPSYGIWQMLPNTNVSRLLARANPDWIMVDCEHGNIDDAAMHEAIPAIAACGVSPCVRVPDTQSWMIKREWNVGAAKSRVYADRKFQGRLMLVPTG